MEKVNQYAEFRCNCYVWCFYQWLKHGGKINFYMKNIVWWGPHSTWTNKQGVEWEFTLRRVRPKPFYWLPVWYKGVVKKAGRWDKT